MTARPAGTLIAETVLPSALPMRAPVWRRGSAWLRAASFLVFLFLYLPLFVVVLYSFSATKVNAWPIKGYSLDWYRQLLTDRDIRNSLQTSVTVGIIAATIAVLLGTLAAFALDRFQFPGKPALRFCIVLPIVLPGIVTGVSMLAFFSMLGWPLSKWTIIVGHGTFCITLIVNNVVARLSQLPPSLDEASADLGATPGKTFWRVTFPLIRPAILAGAILAFTLSFDEVVVTFFLTGREKTLPLLIWGRLRQGISPEINAVATVIIFVSLAGVLLANRFSGQLATGR
jgi:spermidine/putrescine transport system permease protein